MSNPRTGSRRPGADPQIPLSLPTGAAQEPLALEALLKSVARSFYLTLRVLPPALREPIGLAYLLARAADTVADSRAVAPAHRQDALAAFSAALDAPSQSSTSFQWPYYDGSAAATQLPAEHRLLTNTSYLLERLTALNKADAEAVRNVVHTLIQGMVLDLSTFPPESAGTIVALECAEDLDRYTYLVAGCVGEFWTDMLHNHTAAVRGWDVPTQRRWGMEYGKALQLTNVLRDVPRDLRIGRCYLPREQLVAAGLNPEDLLTPRSAEPAQRLLHRWINMALDHYAAASHYVLAMPRRCWRLRLAALWPALIGLQTLVLLAESDSWLDPQRTIKVPRAWVYRMLVLSSALSLSNFATRAWLSHLQRRVRRSLAASPHGRD